MLYVTVYFASCCILESVFMIEIKRNKGLISQMYAGKENAVYNLL